jgi:hypothetical protein
VGLLNFVRNDTVIPYFFLALDGLPAEALA